MDSGYYAACAGLRAQTQALEVIANNLANLNTGGYRAQQPTFHSLLAAARGESISPVNRAINDFNLLGGTRIDSTAGSMEKTGNLLDLAIEGSGYFAVQTRAGTLYTRNGAFRISSAGQLISAQGDPVLGEQGPVNVPSGPVSISPDGTLSVNGAVAGKLRVAQFADTTPLTPAGNSYYSAGPGSAIPAAAAYVRQGMLEASNINAVQGAISLIAVQRHAEMLERALSLFHNEFNRIASDELPRV